VGGADEKKTIELSDIRSERSASRPTTYSANSALATQVTMTAIAVTRRARRSTKPNSPTPNTMKIKAVTNGVGVSADSRTHVAMRAHVPLQTDMPPQMMNSAVPPTIQSAVEKRRIGSTQRSLVTFN
jgi:hypothetical protein